MTDPAFSVEQSAARSLDAHDPLSSYRSKFAIPMRNGEALVYFAGDSLGLMPKSARGEVERELREWETRAVHAHFEAEHPWYSYHEIFREMGARLVGGTPHEVVMMNGLTVNLNLMLVSFYRPTADRFRILVEPNCFPSDLYALQSHVSYHGFDPAEAIVELASHEGGGIVRGSDIGDYLMNHGDEVALVMLPGVNYFSGQLYHMGEITRLGHSAGCVVGFDLAHAAGNVPLKLHDWDVDFAVWCSYKYLNSGPGAVAGCFVHERHGSNADLPRFAGWWGNEPETRFHMDRVREFVPRDGADGWQISNPPILAMAPLKASLEIFDQVGMRALREKSLRLTGYLEYVINQLAGDAVEILTPSDPDERGCQLSLRVKQNAREFFDALSSSGVVADFREPDIVRVAPVPLYNSFTDVWKFGQVLQQIVGER